MNIQEVKEIIKAEGIYDSFVHNGVQCRIIRPNWSWDNYHDLDKKEYFKFSWCGYVGIPKTHPLYGKSYNDSIKVAKETIDRPIDIDKVGAINLFCASVKSKPEDSELDMVLAFDVHGGITYTEDSLYMQPEKDLWWVGFDCGHSGDLSDISYFKFQEYMKYRDKEYVMQECRNLADQLIKYQEAIQ